MAKLENRFADAGLEVFLGEMSENQNNVMCHTHSGESFRQKKARHRSTN